MSKSRLATFVRSRRETLGMTRQQVATATGWSVSSIEKVERGDLVPGLEFLGAIFDTLHIPYLYRAQLVSALFPGMIDRIVGPATAAPTRRDQRDLDLLPYPAADLALPEGRILATNTQWNSVFPSAGPETNLIVWLLTNPLASSVLIEHEAIAHTFAYGLRMLGSLVLSDERMAEIQQQCAINPAWERLYSTDPQMSGGLEAAIRIVDPNTHKLRAYEVRVDKPHQPYRTWATWRLVPLT
ncbi:helix-turn-helix domain-containing protein [Nocardia sp. NPDC004722]